MLVRFFPVSSALHYEKHATLGPVTVHLIKTLTYSWIMSSETVQWLPTAANIIRLIAVNEFPRRDQQMIPYSYTL